MQCEAVKEAMRLLREIERCPAFVRDGTNLAKDAWDKASQLPDLLQNLTAWIAQSVSTTANRLAATASDWTSVASLQM